MRIFKKESYHSDNTKIKFQILLNFIWMSVTQVSITKVRWKNQNLIR